MAGRFRETLGSLLTLVALLAVVMSLDDRVADRLRQVAGEAAARAWTLPSSALAGVLGATMDMPGLQNAFLLTFVAAGVMLLVVMLRT